MRFSLPFALLPCSLPQPLPLPMKSLPPALQAHLDTGATTLGWCWRLTRRDGTMLGFTDHDRDLAFDATTFAAATGFTATEIKDAVGL